MTQRDAETLELVCRRPDAPAGFTFVDAFLSAGGEGLFVYVANDAAADVLARDTTDWASFAHTRMPEAKPFKMIVVSGSGTSIIDIPPLDLAHPLATLFPDGRVLLASARCRWRGPEDYDLNGAIIDPKDGSVKRLLLGDGIMDLAVDARGRIWVSYFDEGVFGNYGWGHPGPRGPGAGGLVCFDETGQQLWVFNTDYDAPIADCYALNATPDEMWAYYYTPFDICRIGPDFSRTVWKTGVNGAHAVAICEDAFLLSHQYREAPGTVHLVGREGAGVKGARKMKLKTPDGSVLDPRTTKPTARGPYLSFLNENGWWRADVRLLVGA